MKASLPLPILLRVFLGSALLMAARPAPAAESVPPTPEETHALMSLFSPFLKRAIAKAGKPLSLETLEARVLTLRQEQDALRQQNARTFRWAEILDEEASLRAFCDSLKEWQHTSDIAALVDHLDSRSNDLTRMRGDGRLSSELCALTAYAKLTGDTSLSAKLVLALDHALASLSPPPKVSSTGNSWEGVDFSGPEDPRRANYAARDAALWLALRYTLTGRPDDAKEVRNLLLQFGEAFPKWTVSTREGRVFAQADDGKLGDYLAAGGDNGLFGVWYPLELKTAFPLVQAFALTRTAMTPADQAAIQNRVFAYFHEFLAPFPFPTHHNLLAFQMEGLILWGLALNDPALIHEAVHWYEEHLQRGFFADGFWKELTPDYHRQVLMTMAYRLGTLLDGYTDPEGYRDARTGEKFENLTLRDRFQEPLSRGLNAWADTLLPDNTSAALTDTEANSPQNFIVPSDVSHHRLLGASGLAVLGAGSGADRSELFLLYKGTHGHQHEDALGLLWYAHGLEILSETTYRGPEESQALRPWYHAASAHNTVIIDGQPQFAQFKNFQVPEEMRLWPDASGLVNNQGKLLVYDTSLPEAGFMAAESVKAYAPLASEFRRIAAMVPLENGDAYVLDIFRVKGGRQHDYAFHAGLNQPYEAEVSVAGTPLDETIYEQIHLRQKYPMTNPVSVLFRHDNGVNLRAHLLSPFGASTTLLEGTGPAIRRPGTAPYFFLRNALPSSSRQLASTFVVAYEAYRAGTESPIRGIRLIPLTTNSEALAIEVTLKDRTDLLLFSPDADQTIRWNSLEFRGSLAFLRYQDGAPILAHLSQGTLLRENGRFDLQCESDATGLVRPDEKEKENILPLDQKIPAPAAGSVVHVDFGDWIRLTYPISGAPGADRIQTAFPLGFRLKSEGFEMQNFPGWRGPGPVRWTIPRHATWRKPANS